MAGQSSVPGAAYSNNTVGEESAVGLSVLECPHAPVDEWLFGSHTISEA
jgi:hypothetical protein